MAEYEPSEERRLRQQQGLVYYGKVTTYTDATHFKVSELAGFGNDFFKNYYVYVNRKIVALYQIPQKVRNTGSTHLSLPLNHIR